MGKTKTNKIKHRIPYDSPLIEHYDIDLITIQSKKIEELIDKRLNQLQKQGINIDECTYYLECIVEEYITKLKSMLEHKYSLNIKYLDNIFHRRASDKMDFEKLKAELEEEIGKTKEEINFLKILYEKYNPLYKGHLNLKSINTNKDDDNDLEETEHDLEEIEDDFDE